MDIITKKLAMELVQSGRADEVKSTKHKYYKLGLFAWEKKERESKERATRRAKAKRDNGFTSNRI